MFTIGTSHENWHGAELVKTKKPEMKRNETRRKEKKRKQTKQNKTTQAWAGMKWTEPNQTKPNQNQVCPLGLHAGTPHYDSSVLAAIFVNNN